MAITVTNRFIVPRGRVKTEYIVFSKLDSDTSGTIATRLENPVASTVYGASVGAAAALKTTNLNNQATPSGKTITLAALDAVTGSMICEVWGY